MSDETFIGGPEGQCPVQAQGTLVGHPFYFRSRYSHWSFIVAPKGAKDAVTWDFNLGPCVYRRAGYVGPDYQAGWMSKSEARRIILTCSEEFLAGDRQSLSCDCLECRE